jgi:Kef-type K+ transport system membrane component KefB
MSNQELSTRIFMILAIVLVAIRSIGWLSKKIGQPQVVAEMITGVILGPSVIGGIFPGTFNIIITKQVTSVLYCIGQLGLVLYMFVIGLGFNTKLIKSKFHSAAGVSCAGIATPFLLGGVLTYFIFGNSNLFSEKVTFFEAALFTGSAISITAFPMLARIIYEKGLSETRVGTLALAAGSIDDVLAWCMLAVVISSFSGNATVALTAIIGGILYALVTLTCIRPLLAKLKDNDKKNRDISNKTFALILTLVMIGAFYTDYVGIYAVFGAFLMGIAVPKGIISEKLTELITPITSNLLLPIFFIYSGLNTKLSLILSKEMLLIILAVTIIACLGKGIACWFGARLTGEKNSEAMVVGILMNARGLMELILINIGLEKGVITETFYTIMVVMAIITTLMASPLFELVYKKYKDTFKLLEIKHDFEN